ncbi:HAD hydrolase family protein [Pseudodesulfovibrio sp. F-1]|uniref:HAD hydrolase family protein n=2 Tax=Pseudodesulfovibrio alkaliphilus TaxID=2661613 RepID=A0A7K1KNH0_9BACT|nr:HAD hydrolase family protein [Pseudodesulfovibrio alkaliphilus]
MSIAFYGGLGFVATPEPGGAAGPGTLLLGAFGQSLRLIPAVGRGLAHPEDGPARGLVLRLMVADVAAADRAIRSASPAGSDGTPGTGVGGAPLYRGPDGELILLEARGLPGLERVRLVVYDFDGVMTDNRVFVDQDGRESVAANRSDGLGVGIIRRLGVDQCILSTETNPVVMARADKIGLAAEGGVADKAAALTALAQRRGVSLAEILFVGNDVNDAGAMALAGFCVAPADAHPAAAALAGYVTLARGGRGVIRELADLLAASRA